VERHNNVLTTLGDWIKGAGIDTAGVVDSLHHWK